MKIDAGRSLSEFRGAPCSRREMLARSGMGFGGMALSYMLQRDRLLGGASKVAAGPSLDSRPPQFAGKARAVIQLVQTGGPSQMDLFDRKPELQRRHGQVYEVKAESFQKGSEENKLLGAHHAFRRYGKCGLELSVLLPHLGSIIDDVCLVRSMVSAHNNHTEAILMLSNGKIFPGRPTFGAWISYGLGTENQNLPAFVVLRDPDGYATSGGFMSQSGWLPALYGGTEFNTRGIAIHNLQPPPGVSAPSRKSDLDFLAKLNESHRQDYPENSELETRIRNYELAARMQLNAENVLDFTEETRATRALYGLDNSDPKTASYALRCLMARRLVEAGVRFVQVFVGDGQPWDHHANINGGLVEMCGRSDQPSAALIKDLKSRGLLDSTIVMWAGEFGRLPVSQGGSGRDHNKFAGSLWLAGGGLRQGYAHGATDDFGYKAVDKTVTVTDLFATVLHQMGIDHQRLTYPHAGRAESVTDAPVTGARVHFEMVA